MNEDFRQNRRRIAVELMVKGSPVFDPVRELMDAPLSELDKGENLKRILKAQIKRLLDINITKTESRLMLEIASGYSIHKIAQLHDRDLQTVMSQRETLYKKLRMRNPELDYGAFSYRAGTFNQDTVIMYVTLRTLNQLI